MVKRLNLAKINLKPAELEFINRVAEGWPPGAACESIDVYRARPASHAAKLLARPDIQLALSDRFRDRINGRLVAKALSTLDNLLDRDDIPAATRLGAARTVLEYSRLHRSLAPRASEAVDRKALSDMDLGELQAFIAAGSKALERMRDADDADLVTVDGAGNGYVIESQGEDTA